jgi:hypothetical protein
MNKLAIIASLSAGLTVLPVANAGQVFHSPITIGHSTGNYATYAYGSFHQALSTTDHYEYIGCAASSDTVSTSYIYCWAADSTGHNYASCYNLSPSDPSRQIVASVTEYSRIYFSADSSGHCTDVYIDNSTYNK